MRVPSPAHVDASITEARRGTSPIGFVRLLIREAAIPGAFFLLVVALWELTVRLGSVPPYLLPSPSGVLSVLTRDWQTLGLNALVTMGEAMAGFALGNAAGFMIGVLFSSWRVAEKAMYPYVIALKTTPILALAPLLVIWFGTGWLSKIIASALICFFPIVVNATRGLRAAQTEAVDLFRSLAASRLQTFLKLRLPTSLPYIFSALRISTSLSVVGAVVGEFVGAQQGLGYLILVSSYRFETEMMIAATIAAAIGGVAFFGLVVLLEALVVPWSQRIEET